MRPPSSSRPPKASVYAVTTHCRSASVMPQVVLRRRQRDVHDRGVEHDHQLRDRDERERQPALVVVGRRGGVRRRLVERGGHAVSLPRSGDFLPSG